jgi:hypothetical protein
VAVTRDAVYVTDSFNPQLVVIPLPSNGSLPSTNSATLLTVTGDFHQTDGANLNGIVAKSGMLVVAQSSTGNLFRVDPATGIAKKIDLGDDVALDRVDGLELQGRTLYAVRNSDVVTVDGRPRLAAGTVVSAISPLQAQTSPRRRPYAGRLWAANARFGTGPTPDTKYWITQLPLRPSSG